MKILHTVEFYSPSQGGMQEVVKQISERLVKLGHEVTVATSFLPERKYNIINGVKIVSFYIKGNSVYGIKGDLLGYQNYILNSDFDIVTNFAAQQWATDAVLPILDRIKAKKVFVPTGFSSFYLPEYKKYFENMKIWMKKYNMNVFLSEDYRDINFAKKNKIAKRMIIPNGAACDEFVSNTHSEFREKFQIRKNAFLVILVGSHTGVKGHREAIEIFQKANIQNSVLVIIGNTYNIRCEWECIIRKYIFNLSPMKILKNKKIMILNLFRTETVSAYHGADLFLFPSNIECSPIVLFECMAAKLPFLTSDVGNSKEIISWSNGGKLLPTEKNKRGFSNVRINESVKLLEYLYNKKGERIKMGIKGYKAWKRRFTWEKIAKSYEQLYQKLIKNGVS